MRKTKGGPFMKHHEHNLTENSWRFNSLNSAIQKPLALKMMLLQ